MKVNVLHLISFLPIIYAHISCTSNLVPIITPTVLINTPTPIIKLPFSFLSKKFTSTLVQITESTRTTSSSVQISSTTLSSRPTTTLSSIQISSTPSSSRPTTTSTTLVEFVATPTPTSTPPVQRIEEYIFKSDDISNILRKHNDERFLKNITDISWNTNLKDSSQLWSNNLASRGCILEHKLFSSGQNLYAGYGWIEPDLSQAIQAWINEKELLDVPNITFEQIGHYLIIINNGFNEVGCASSINIDNNCFVVTCNYN